MLSNEPKSFAICQPASRSSSERVLTQWRSPSILQRLAGLAVLMVLELVAVSTWLDTAALDGRGGLMSIIGDWGPIALRWMVAFSALWLTFSWRTLKDGLRSCSADLGEMIPRAYWSALGHALSLSAFAGLSVLIFRKHPPHFQQDLLAVSFVAAGVLTVVSAASVFLPLRLWFRLLLETRLAIIYASLGALGACLFGARSQYLWRRTGHLTFNVVEALLRPFIADVVADPASLSIGSHRFSVRIEPACSGLEGVGLILIFSIAWLWLFRHEYRFPRALLLVPAGVILVWFLNAVRIAGLILIGNAGAADIAAGGFHSQAGWIAFNIVALCSCLTLRRVPWLTVSHDIRSLGTESTNPTAPYVIPLLAILGAGMVSRAASAGFEWLYPLRFFAAAAALWFFRDAYKDLEWRFGRFAFAIGGSTLALWLGLDWLSRNHSDNGIASGLAGLPAFARLAWLVFRTMAAVITVPIAEELAFRGFLIRRLISVDFDSLDLRRYTYPALILSSLAFGLMHGERWIAGTIAGLLYAAALLRRGRIGDAVVAHAVTNAGLAAWVLLRGDWSLW